MLTFWIILILAPNPFKMSLKILTILIGFSVIGSINCGGIISSNCSSSGIYFKDLVCHLRTENGESRATIGFEILKKIKNLYVRRNISFHSFTHSIILLFRSSHFSSHPNRKAAHSGPRWWNMRKSTSARVSRSQEKCQCSVRSSMPTWARFQTFRTHVQCSLVATW